MILCIVVSIPKAKELMNNINLVLREGGFKIKNWIMTGNKVMDEFEFIG